MAETQNSDFHDDFQTRLASLEKSIQNLRRQVTASTEETRAAHADASAARENTSRVLALLEEVIPHVRRAAPLLDSPMAKLATSPAGGVLSMFTGGRRG